MIICAAIKIKYLDRNDEKQTVVICGHRHGDCYYTISKLDVFYVIEKIEGFIDNQGKFFDRQEAYVHARNCGQLSQSNIWYKEEHSECELYSEDLY